VQVEPSAGVAGDGGDLEPVVQRGSGRPLQQQPQQVPVRDPWCYSLPHQEDNYNEYIWTQYEREGENDIRKETIQAGGTYMVNVVGYYNMRLEYCLEHRIE
jgi:hypothetical protein